MKHRHFIRNIAFIFLLVISLVLPSCSEDDGAGRIFKMNIENNPSNLDPQLTKNKESMMIITNMMEGLVKELPEGGIVPAAAESFEMSDNGMKYTFYLRKDRKWESVVDFDEPVTADDFVFAFQRIFDPETNSPYSEDFMCIKNGAAVLNGTASTRELGVKAKDKYTVEFTLEYPYFDFLSLLTKTAAMPCSREFFKLSKGRYGMAADAAASNGAFYIREWNYDPYWNENYVIMRRNITYNESDRVYPYSINFFITGDSSSDAASFAQGDVDCCFLDHADEKLISANKYSAVSVKTAGLVFNPDSAIFKNKMFREALAKSVNREAFSHSLPEGLTEAFGIIPGGITIQGRSYREIMPDRPLSIYDTSASRIWETALNSTGTESVDNIRITVPDSFPGKDIIYDITERWQNDMLFYCGVEIVSDTEYESKIEEGNYDIALVEIGCNENSAYEFLEYFEDSEFFSGNSIPGYMSSLNNIKTSVNLTDGAENIKSAEASIIGDYIFIPLCYEDEYLLYSNSAADLAYYPFISSVWFGEGKYYG